MGLRDTVKLQECMRSDAVIARIDSSLAVAVAIRATGTPTVILDGRMYKIPPAASTIYSQLGTEYRNPASAPRRGGR